MQELTPQAKRALVLDLYVVQRLGFSRIHKQTGISKARISAWVKEAGVTIEPDQRRAAYSQECADRRAKQKAERAAQREAKRPARVEKPKRVRLTPEEAKARKRERHRRWRAANQARYNAWQRAYLAANRETVAAWKRRARSKPQARIREALRSRLKEYLRQPIGTPSHQLFGCSSSDLRKHIESLMVGGMTWRGYGRSWHIDHIVPLSSFDLSDPAQRAKACHYTNLRPLWAVQNLAKGSKLDWNGRCC